MDSLPSRQTAATLCWPILATVLCGAGVGHAEQRPFPLAPDQALGVGVVRVVGGNQAAARHRALGIARLDAVRGAVRARLSAEQQQQHAAGVERIVGQHRRLASRYRVVSEQQQADHRFQIEIAVTLRLKRLRQAVDKLIGKPTARVSAPPARVRVALWCPPALALRARALLDVEGMQAADVGGPAPGESSVPLPQLRAAARAAGAGLLLTLRLKSTPAPGVRGIELPAVRAEVNAEVTAVAQGVALATGSSAGHGYGAKKRAAERMAGEQALTRAFGSLRQALRRRRPAVPVSGERLIHVTGLAGFEQIEQLCRMVDQRVAGVSRCQLRRVAGREVWFALATRLSPAELAKRLAATSFGSFVVAVQNDAGSIVSLKASPPPSATPIDEGESS